MARPMAMASLFAAAAGQQIGKNMREAHLSMPVQKCVGSACTAESGEVVLDANWRWTHSVDGYANCYTGSSWDATLCPDAATCTKNCALEGVSEAQYATTYGVTATSGGVALKFKTGNNVGSRLYLMEDESTYKLFKLKNKEFSFDVDVSTLPCGLNGALYLVEMPADGGVSTTNPAGAKYGTGYCDGQCPHDVKFIQGEANIKDWDSEKAKGHYGSCCAEMDLWEANKMATAYTAHPCALDGPLRCEGKDCGDGGGWSTGQRYMGKCDADGCDFNSYRMGDKGFYGAGAEFTVDTGRPFTVVTQFLTADGTDSGELSEIRRIYVQDGKVFNNSAANIAGLTADSLTRSACTAQKKAFTDVDDFDKKGGLKQMGEAIARGMVLVLSLWDDAASQMLWLDSDSPASKPAAQPGVARGPCSTDSGKPADVRAKSPDATVKYMNVKYGDIGSTIHSKPAPNPPPSPPAPGPSPPSPPSPRPSPTGGQCCYGGCSDNCQGGWCGQSQTNCEGNCNGKWCPQQSHVVV
jgi:cellulose 1,4-beta-cellobiosidase